MYCVVECGSKQCKSWFGIDYLLDRDDCRSQGTTYWIFAQILSIIPIPGLSSLYIGKTSDGLFEFFNGFASLTLTAALDSVSARQQDDGLCMMIITLFVDVTKIRHYTEKEEIDELIIIFAISLFIMCISAFLSDHRTRSIAVALGLTLPLGIIKWVKHLFMILFNMEVDVNGCALISIVELFV